MSRDVETGLTIIDLIDHLTSNITITFRSIIIMQNMKKTIVAIYLAISPMLSQADSGVESLSPELRTLLGKEMAALEKGMKEIIPAYISGDMSKIVHIANNIKNSYVLKQNITEQQKHELMNKLPRSFLALDKKFHGYGAMLAHVAEDNHNELVGFYFSRLTDTCVECHSQYASHKFPAFIKKDHAEGHKH